MIFRNSGILLEWLAGRYRFQGPGRRCKSRPAGGIEIRINQPDDVDAAEHLVGSLAEHLSPFGHRDLRVTLRPRLNILDDTLPSISERDFVVEASDFVGFTPACGRVQLLGLYEEQPENTDEAEDFIPEEDAASARADRYHQ